MSDDCASVRTADRFNYDMLVANTEGGSIFGGDQELSCTELLCGMAREDEPKLNMGCCTVSKRVVKNMVMFTVVLIIYIFLLALITGKNNHSNQAS